MSARSLALVLGLLYLGLGALGLMPGALGFLPADPMLALVHLALGAWAIAAYAGRASAQRFARSASFVFAALALVGMLHGMDRFLMPLDGPTVWLHLASAGLAGFVGWRPRSGERRSLAGDRRRAQLVTVALERRNGIDDRRKTPAAA